MRFKGTGRRRFEGPKIDDESSQALPKHSRSPNSASPIYSEISPIERSPSSFGLDLFITLC